MTGAQPFAPSPRARHPIAAAAYRSTPLSLVVSPRSPTALSRAARRRLPLHLSPSLHQRIGERTEDGEEEASDEAGAHDLEQQLAPRRQARGRPEHEEAVREHQEEVSEDGGGAGQEAIRLLALPLLCRGGEAEHGAGGAKVGGGGWRAATVRYEAAVRGHGQQGG
jgi:hypothetical protein